MANDANRLSQNNSDDAKGFQANAKDSEVYQAGNDINIDRSDSSSTIEQAVDGSENQAVAQANGSILINKIGDGSTVNILRSPPAFELGAPFLVDPLPDYYVPRPEHSDAVKAELLAEGKNAIGTLVVSAIYGLGGIGKSVLARAIAHDPEVQAHFKEGVLWVTLGQEPDLLPKLGGWLHALGDYNSKPTSMDVAVMQLRLLLQEKQMLLVIDDVWEPEHAEPFRVGGSKCCVLITTREAQIKNARAHNLDEMRPEQALQMLKQRLPKREFTTEDEEKAQLLAKEVGYLPLALELAAAQVEDGVRWGELLEDLQAEIADLASFDGSGLALKTGKDEKQLRDRSLLASFNLSLKRLPREQLEQFAWLGIVQEDAEINRSLAAKLWGVKLREARALLQFFKQRALLIPGVGQEEQATYRTHDLVRSISKRLLASPGEGDGGFAFVGFETSLPEAHSILLGRYRETTASGLWHELADDGYIFAQLTWHMEQAGQEAQIHQLFQETTAEGRNGWYEACDRLGKLSYFVTDLGRAWALAEELFEKDATEAIVLQWRYALIQTTLNSMAQNVPAELLARFVETEFWTPAQGLAYAQQIQSSNEKSKAIFQLVPHLPKSFLSKALDISRDIENEYFRAVALSALASPLPELWSEILELIYGINSELESAKLLSILASLLPKPLFADVLELIKHFQSESDRALVLCAMAPYLPQSLLPEALKIACEADNFKCGSDCASVLHALAPYLPDFLLPKALELTQNFHFEHSRTIVLRALTPRFSKSLLLKVLRFARNINSIFVSERAEVLSILAPYLPELWQETLEITRNIKNESHRASILRSLVPHLPESLLTEALELSNNIQGESSRASILRALAHRLPELWPKALELSCKIKYEPSRASVLCTIAPHLPQPLLQEAWELSSHIKDEASRASLLCALAFQLPELLPEALLACNVKDETSRATALSEIAPQLPKFLLPKALELTSNIHDESARARTLSALAPQLHKSLLTGALELTRNINDEYSRIRALSALASQQPELWPEVLELSCDIRDEHSRARELSALTPRLPKSLLPEVLELIRNINDEYSHAKALSVLAPRLPESLLSEALALTHNLKDESYRATALSTLSPQLPESLLSEALVLTRNINDQSERARTLTALAPHLPESLLQEALKLTQTFTESYRIDTLSALALKWPKLWSEALVLTCNINDERYRASTLSILTPQLPKYLLPKALEATRYIRDRYSYASTLSTLAPRLPELWPKTLGLITRGFISESESTSIICALAPQLPKSLLSDTLKIVRNLNDERNRASAICALAPHLPKSLWSDAWELTQNLKEDSKSASVLQALAPHLPESLLTEALKLSRDIKQDKSYAALLITLAPRLTEPLFPEALKLIHNITCEESRASVLSALAPHLPESLCEEAFTHINGIKDLSYRASAWTAFLSRLNLSEHKSWQQTLNLVKARKRPELIQDFSQLEGFMVALGSETALNGALQAMREVCIQWP